MAISYNAHPFRSADQSSRSKIPSNVHRSTMQAAAAHPATAPAPPPPRPQRVYTAVDPRCEWARTDDADTLVVDVSGFRKEELKVLYNTSRKLKIAGERQDGGNGGARWARFLKSFPVSRSVDTSAIRAVMDKDEAVLYVILPKGSPPPPPPPSSLDKQKEEQPGPGSSLSLPHGEQKGGTGSAGGSSGSSNGSFWSAQEDAVKNMIQEDAVKNKIEESSMEPEEAKVKNKIEESSMEPEEAREKRQEKVTATQDAPTTDAINKEGDDGDGKNRRWWKKIRPFHVLGLALILALVGAGAWVMYVMLL